MRARLPVDVRRVSAPRLFSLLWLAQLIYRVTGSALAVGLTLMVTAIPSLVIGLLAGVFVDRHDRKQILTWTCLIQAVIVGMLAVVVGIQAIALPGLYLLLFLNAGVKQFFDPAHESLIPELANDEEPGARGLRTSLSTPT